MHASLCWHPCTLLSPCSTILVDMRPSSLHQQRRSMSSRGKAIFKVKQMLGSHTTGIKSSRNMIERPDPPSCSMHPRRKNCYETPRGNPVTVQPARVDTIHSTTICKETRVHATQASTPPLAAYNHEPLGLCKFACSM